MVDGKFLSNVFSNMNPSAKIMVVGQNPGRDEAERDEPFVGEAGKRFDEAMLRIVGLTRKDLYIANTIRCYTPGNRKPFESEITSCRYFLDKEIELIKPKIIIALGGIALKQLTGLNGVMKHHGKVIHSIRYGVPVMSIIHPSPLNTNMPDKKAAFYDDIQKLKEFLDA
ncbi:MAG: uracil-DNA glycosylase [Candidatus Riflemargulisbacteria bacterium]